MKIKTNKTNPKNLNNQEGEKTIQIALSQHLNIFSVQRILSFVG